MKNKKTRILLVFICIVVIVLGVIVKGILGGKKSINMPLNEAEVLGAVEIKASPNFILLINKKERVSNIIFLNEESVNLLSNQGIEGKTIEAVVEKIVDMMKNKDSFFKTSEFVLVHYDNTKIFSIIKEEMNKQFVVYGIEKEVITTHTSFEEKLESLNIKKDVTKSSLTQLYNYSQQLLKK